MRISLALGRRQPLNRQMAWGCLTANVAVPGSGSLLAGRRAGYVQLFLALAGMACSILFGLQFVIWFLSNWTQLHQDSADPFGNLSLIWQHVRWALLGILVFALSWLWGVLFGFLLVHEAKRNEEANLPPKAF